MAEGRGVPPDWRVTLSESAARRIAQLREQENTQQSFLRLAVSGGGCSGFQYGFTFDEKRPTDHVLAVRDIEVIVDPQSALKLHGSTVDFIEDMRGAGFSVENPNATGGSCGCGKSFS